MPSFGNAQRSGLGEKLRESCEQAVDIVTVRVRGKADAKPALVAETEVTACFERIEVAGWRIHVARGQEQVGICGVSPIEREQQGRRAVCCARVHRDAGAARRVRPPVG